MVSVLEGENVSYDAEDRQLSFLLGGSDGVAHTDQAYRFTYITDITVASRQKLINDVHFSDRPTQTDVKKEYDAHNIQALGIMSRCGWVRITKQDSKNSNTKLSGAEFSIYTKDSSKKLLRSATTNAAGEATLYGLPVGEYILEETKAPTGYVMPLNNTYIVRVTRNTDGTLATTIGNNAPHNRITIENASANDVGNLEISKTVTGTGADNSKEFKFTVAVDNTAGNTYACTRYTPNAGGTTTQTEGTCVFNAQNEVEFNLKHGERVVIKALPRGNDNFTVTEDDYTNDGYVAMPANVGGSILGKSTATAAFTNAFVKGLAITKKLESDDTDRNREFNFTITIANASSKSYVCKYYDGNGIAQPDDVLDFSASGMANFKLKGGHTIVIQGLTRGWAYKVEETEANKNGYKTTMTNNEGSISADVVTAEFTNKLLGSLTINKTVTPGGENDREFVFTIDIPGAANGSYPYTRAGGGAGTLPFTNGKASVKLKHGESITINELVSGWHYTVTEDAAGYAVTKTGDTGSVRSTGSTASFINTAVGKLAITKTVPQGDKQKEFEFTVVVAGASGRYDYTRTDSAGTETNGTLLFTDNKSEFTLKHGEGITFNELPYKAAYTVTETEDTAYYTSKTGDVGIADLTLSTAAFTNTLIESGDDNDPSTPISTGGRLKISKTVKDGEAGMTRSFAFTLRLSDNTRAYAYNGYGISGGVVSSGDTFYLAHGQSIEIMGIAPGTTYTVEEESYPTLGFEAKRSKISGTVDAARVSSADFVNVKTEFPEPPATGDTRFVGAVMILLSCLMYTTAERVKRRRS